jgi:hypothetical protein
MSVKVAGEELEFQIGIYFPCDATVVLFRPTGFSVFGFGSDTAAQNPRLPGPTPCLRGDVE